MQLNNLCLSRFNILLWEKTPEPGASACPTHCNTVSVALALLWNIQQAAINLSAALDWKILSGFRGALHSTQSPALLHTLHICMHTQLSSECGVRDTLSPWAFSKANTNHMFLFAAHRHRHLSLAPKAPISSSFQVDTFVGVIYGSSFSSWDLKTISVLYPSRIRNVINMLAVTFPDIFLLYSHVGSLGHFTRGGWPNNSTKCQATKSDICFLTHSLSGKLKNFQQQRHKMPSAVSMCVFEKPDYLISGLKPQWCIIIFNLYWLSFGLDVKQPDHFHSYTLWHTSIYEL